MRVQSINLNMIPSGVMPIIHLSQYDEEDDGALLFMIYNGSTLYDLTDCSAVIEGTKPDETVFSYPCTVYTNYITSAVYQQMATVEGTYEAEIRISNDDEVIGTLNFQIVVEAAGVSTVDLSETDVPTLLESIQSSVDEAAYWAEQAESSVTGVTHFNGRSGSVLPVAGDYDAEMITYDNTTSGMTAVTVQEAIDELEARDASDLEYDNTSSGLTATNAQAAIDELATLATAAEARDGDGYDEDETYGPVDNTDGYPSYCIENNVMYKNIVSCSGVAPSDDTSGTYWEETDIATELSSLNSELTDTYLNSGDTFTLYGNFIGHFTSTTQFYTTVYIPKLLNDGVTISNVSAINSQANVYQADTAIGLSDVTMSIRYIYGNCIKLLGTLSSSCSATVSSVTEFEMGLTFTTI